jgi:hypothetical protein
VVDIYKQIELHCAKKHCVIAGGSRKAIGDFMIDEYHPVNVKSNNLGGANYSPNIISAKKLLLWLRNPENKLSFIFVDYKLTVNGTIKVIRDSGLIPVEHLSWECLTIEAQGWGVIQMCKKLKLNRRQDRKSFLKGLKTAYKAFMLKEHRKMAQIKKLLKGL